MIQCKYAGRNREENTKVLVLGGSGFLGGILIKKLRDKGFSVTGTYNTTIRNDMLHLNILDIKETKNLISICTPNIIIWAIKNLKNEKSLSQYGLNNIINCMPKQCKLIYISTNVFNDGIGSKREEDEPNYTSKGHYADEYILAKIVAENKLKAIKNHIIIRPGVIYGKDINGKWDSRINNMINHLRNNQQIKISNKRCATWVNVEFLGNSIIELINMNFIGIIHIGSLVKESGYSINKKIANILGLNASLILPLNENNEEITDDSFDLSLSKKLLLQQINEINIV